MKQFQLPVEEQVSRDVSVNLLSLQNIKTIAAVNNISLIKKQRNAIYFAEHTLELPSGSSILQIHSHIIPRNHQVFDNQMEVPQIQSLLSYSLTRHRYNNQNQITKRSPNKNLTNNSQKISKL